MQQSRARGSRDGGATMLSQSPPATPPSSPLPLQPLSPTSPSTSNVDGGACPSSSSSASPSTPAALRRRLFALGGLFQKVAASPLSPRRAQHLKHVASESWGEEAATTDNEDHDDDNELDVAALSPAFAPASVEECLFSSPAVSSPPEWHQLPAHILEQIVENALLPENELMTPWKERANLFTFAAVCRSWRAAAEAVAWGRGRAQASVLPAPHPALLFAPRPVAAVVASSAAAAEAASSPGGGAVSAAAAAPPANSSSSAASRAATATTAAAAAGHAASGQLLQCSVTREDVVEEVERNSLAGVVGGSGSGSGESFLSSSRPRRGSDAALSSSSSSPTSPAGLLRRLAGRRGGEAPPAAAGSNENNPDANENANKKRSRRAPVRLVLRLEPAAPGGPAARPLVVSSDGTVLSSYSSPSALTGDGGGSNGASEIEDAASCSSSTPPAAAVGKLLLAARLSPRSRVVTLHLDAACLTPPVATLSRRGLFAFREGGLSSSANAASCSSSPSSSPSTSTGSGGGAFVLRPTKERCAPLGIGGGERGVLLGREAIAAAILAEVRASEAAAAAVGGGGGASSSLPPSACDAASLSLPSPFSSTSPSSPPLPLARIAYQTRVRGFMRPRRMVIDLSPASSSGSIAAEGGSKTTTTTKNRRLSSLLPFLSSLSPSSPSSAASPRSSPSPPSGPPRIRPLPLVVDGRLGVSLGLVAPGAKGFSCGSGSSGEEQQGREQQRGGASSSSSRSPLPPVPPLFSSSSTYVSPRQRQQQQRLLDQRAALELQLRGALQPPTRLANKAPHWNAALRCWCLNFRGRVRLASVKNFQLVGEPEPGAAAAAAAAPAGPAAAAAAAAPALPRWRALLPGGGAAAAAARAAAAVPATPPPPPPLPRPVLVQFGKVGPDAYILDFDPAAVSAAAAFSAALSMFEPKKGLF